MLTATLVGAKDAGVAGNARWSYMISLITTASFNVTTFEKPSVDCVVTSHGPGPSGRRERAVRFATTASSTLLWPGV